jgi:hypothetical protein
MAEMTIETITKRVRLVRKVGIILAIVLGVIVAIGRTQVYLDASDMLAHGVTTNATVMEKKHWLETGRKGRKFDRYAIVYQFASGSGEKIGNEVRVGEDDYATINQGATVSVVYKSSTPSVNDTHFHYEHKASIINVLKDVFLLMIIVIAAGYFIGFLVKSKLQKRLATQAAT